jgi:hypothetical protein
MLLAQDILQFHFSPTAFNQSAQKLIPNALRSVNHYRMDRLQKLTDEVGANSFKNSGAHLIPQIFRKFKIYTKNTDYIFERKELRTLTYALAYSEKHVSSIFSSDNELKSALHLLDAGWRDSFFVGLIDCFLKNWETRHRQSLHYLEKFISGKLESYSGSRNTLISFKNNKRFFDTRNGDLILGDTLSRLNKPIMEAPKMLSVPDSWFAYPYFSRVIVAYYDRNKDNISNELVILNEILALHNNSATNKRVISKLIIQVNQPGLSGLQDQIKSIAFKQIGDPGNVAMWSPFENASEIEKTELLNARNILDEWIAKQFIDVFFRVCINDERRKKFWLKIASLNKLTFKVYGTSYTKGVLKSDTRIAEYVDSRFESVSSKRDVSAFILYVGDYMLIEFSDEGYAFYAYIANGNNKPDLNRNLSSVDQLRNTGLPRLIYRSGNSITDTNSEGPLSHRDGDVQWEQVFEYWLKNVAKINV